MHYELLRFVANQKLFAASDQRCDQAKREELTSFIGYAYAYCTRRRHRNRAKQRTRYTRGTMQF